MARHGENIRKRKDGRWEGRYLVYDEEKERKRYHSVYARSYNEVREKLTEQRNRLRNQSAESKGLIEPDHIKLNDMAQEWLVEIKEKRKQSTYVKYSLLCHNYLEKYFKDIMLSELNDAFVRTKISDHLSDSVYKSIYCILNQILKYVSRQYCVTMPVLERTASETKKEPVKVLAKSEQKKLIVASYSEMDLFKMAVLICLFTGLRLGELCALKWSDIDFENKILMVRRTVQRLNVEGGATKTLLVESSPKSACSKREIPLADTALELFVKFQNDKEYVFGGEKPMEPRSLQYHFKKILEEAEISDKNFHILRHTFSTNCIESGADVKSLSEMLGHSDVQITLNRYVHPSMDVKRQYMDQLLKIYGQIHGQAV